MRGGAGTALDRTLGALADPVRRSVISLLREQPRRAGELAEAVRMSPPALSRHLRVLRSTGLVEEEAPAEDGRVRLLRLRPEPLRALRGWLGEVEEGWIQQLDSFRRHVERTGGGARRRRARRPGRR